MPKIRGTRRNIENRRTERRRVRDTTATTPTTAPETKPTAPAPVRIRRVDADVRRASRDAVRHDPRTAQLRHRLNAGPEVQTQTMPTRFVDDGGSFRVRRGGVQSSEDDLEAPESREVLRDPGDVNVEQRVGGGSMGGVLSSVAAEMMIAQTRDEEYDALSNDAQENFDTVSETIQDDPDAVRAFDRMLATGELRGTSGEAVLDELAGLTTDDLADGLERDELVSDLVQEIADPAAINQQGYGTCVPTTASIHLATNNPGEYVRLVRGLAQEDGKVRMANGDEISRHADTIDEPDDYTGAERSQSSRLLVPALMEYGNGSRDYDAVDDSHQRDYGFMHRYDGRGLGNGGMDRIMEGITGETYDSFTLNGDESGDVTDELASRTAAGEQIPVALLWREDAGHEVLVTRVDDNHVYYTNPWGQEERMDRSEFEPRLIGVNQQAA